MPLSRETPLGLPPLSCPQCGGPVRPDQDEAFVRCDFCESRLFLDPGGAVRHEIVPFVVAAAELPARLGRWLSSRDVAGAPREISKERIFFPFWVLEAGDRARFFPAAPLLAELGTFRLPAGDRRAFREELASEAELVPVGAFLEGLERHLEAGAAGDLSRKIRLVHLPFWEVSFDLWNRRHRIWIDGASGQIVPHTIPPSVERWLDRAFASILAGAWAVLSIGLWFSLENERRAVLALILSAASFPLVYFGIRFLTARWESR